jgi:hypothetical protein
MAAAELANFIAAVRAQTAAALTQLDTVDSKELPLSVHAEYDSVRKGWLRLLAITEDDVVELHVAACEAAGRELTEDELRGLVGRHPHRFQF